VITEDVNAGWQNTDANVQITITDTNSNVSQAWIGKNVSLQNRKRNKFTSNFTDLNALFTTDGNHTLDINATDQAGNTTTHPTKYVLIDKKNPTTIADYNTGWQSTDANITFSCSDSNSGCNTTTVTKDTNSTGGISLGSPATGNAIDLNALFNTDGNWAVDFNSTDNVTNAEDVNRIYILIDKSAPNVSNTLPTSATEISVATYTFTVDVNDSYSGVQGCDLNVHRQDTNAIAKTTSVTASAGQCSYTYTLGQANLNYYAAWKVFDNSSPVNYSADINSSNVLTTFTDDDDDDDDNNGGNNGGDTGGTGGATGGISGGGFGGGGGGSVSLSIDDWSIDKSADVGKPTPISLTISNHAVATRVIVIINITRLGELEFLTSENIGILNENETRKVVLENEWVPNELGTYIIEIKLMSINGRTVFTELSEAFGITGELRYDVAVECLEKVVIPDSDAHALITLLNLGDYYQDVDLSWRVEDPNFNVIEFGNIPIAVQTDDSRKLEKQAYIPDDALTGIYTFYAEVDFEGEKRQGSCSFTVEKNEDYYKKKLDSIEEKLRKLDSIIEEKKAAGISIDELEQEIREIRQMISDAKEQTTTGQFIGLGEKIIEIERRLMDITRNLKASTELSIIRILTTIVFFITGLILLVIVLILLTLSLSRSVRKAILKLKGQEALKEVGALDEVILRLESSISILRSHAEKLWMAIVSFFESIASLLISLGTAIKVLAPVLWSLSNEYYSRFKRTVIVEARHLYTRAERKAIIHGRELHPAFRGMITIESWKFDKTPSVGNSAPLKINVSGLGNQKPKLLVFIEIFKGNEIEFSASEVIETIQTDKQEIALGEQWTPAVAGTHKIELKVGSTDQTRTHSRIVEAFEVNGRRRFDLSLECLEKTVKPGNLINSMVTISNKGDYDQNVTINWWVEGPNNELIGEASSNISLDHNESENLVKKAIIPIGAIRGTYYFNAEVDYEQEKKQARGTFTVDGKNEAKPNRRVQERMSFSRRQNLFDPVNKDMKSLDGILEDKKMKGVQTSGLEKRIQYVKNRIAKAKIAVNLREFKFFDNAIVSRIDKEIKGLIELTKNLKK
ncbi:MAG: hypothetical protein ABIH20_05975, partial [Candidatus Diapherotrites archaeon]